MPSISTHSVREYDGEKTGEAVQSEGSSDDDEEEDIPLAGGVYDDPQNNDPDDPARRLSYLPIPSKTIDFLEQDLHLN